MAESVAFSQISYTCIFGWSIRNIPLVNSLQRTNIRYDNADWKLVIRKTYEEFLGDTISICLAKVSEKKSTHEFKVITYLEDNSKKREFLQDQNINISSEQKLGTEIEIWKIVVDYFQKRFEKMEMDSVVTFMFMFTSMEYGKDVKKYDKQVQTPHYMELEPSLESLSRDLSVYMGEGDVELRSQSTNVRAHRVILSARSKELAEKLSNYAIKIVNVDIYSCVLKEFVVYLYTGKVSLSEDNVEPFYEAASIYAIQSLRNLCSNYMLENLTEYNAYNYLILADKHIDKDFKEKVMSYIIDKKMIVKDAEWVPFCSDHNKLAIEVLNKACAESYSADYISDIVFKFPNV